MIHVLAIFIAVVYSHTSEWFIHKYVLHGIGRNKDSFWSFHWHAHHKNCRKHDYYDSDYLDGWVGPPIREKMGLLGLILLHVPTLMFLPYTFFGTICFMAIRYYRIHKYSHLNPEWAKINLKWHYDHHMGKNQDQNWGVTVQWTDKLFNTRMKY